METGYSIRQLRYLDAMGIPAWTPRQLEKRPMGSAESTPSLTPAASADPERVCVDGDGFAEWFSKVHLAQSERSRLLEGSASSSLLVIEDATLCVPGQRPFAGPSSRLFDAMLKAIGLNRGTTLLGTLAMSSADSGLSTAPLGALPDMTQRAVLFYSAPAGQHGLGEMDSLRERVHILSNGLPCVVSYHPSYLMDNTELKRAAWNDLKRVSQLLD